MDAVQREPGGHEQHRREVQKVEHRPLVGDKATEEQHLHHETEQAQQRHNAEHDHGVNKTVEHGAHQHTGKGGNRIDRECADQPAHHIEKLVTEQRREEPESADLKNGNQQVGNDHRDRKDGHGRRHIDGKQRPAADRERVVDIGRLLAVHIAVQM